MKTYYSYYNILILNKFETFQASMEVENKTSQIRQLEYFIRFTNIVTKTD